MEIDGETVETVTDFEEWGGEGVAPRSLQMVTVAMKLKDSYSLEEKLCPKAETLLCQERSI